MGVQHPGRYERGEDCKVGKPERTDYEGREAQLRGAPGGESGEGNQPDKHEELEGDVFDRPEARQDVHTRPNASSEPGVTFLGVDTPRRP